jgi:homoaconitase
VVSTAVYPSLAHLTLGDESMIPSPNPSPEPSSRIIISPTSDRLQVLEPFSRFSDDEFTNLRVLVKVKGKCTTDHISAAGKWLKYKGHLENIANNTLIGAMNAETDEVNVVYDYQGDGTGVSIPDLGRRWKARGQEWLVVAEVTPSTLVLTISIITGKAQRESTQVYKFDI